MPDRLFLGAEIAASAMSAERLRMTVAAENLAHAGDTRAPGQGLPYARQRVLFQTVIDRTGRETGEVDAAAIASPRYVQRHDPSHPHADPITGMVTESEIDPILELTDLMVATRAYESNANAARGLMRMHENALRIGEA